ncbi:hypothetical protein BX666DRAFT_1868329 [Dichotomocladium elegans]|nr:hypothetical protein BX666DRAFT_1868329 [Dichotomocladium elegans]
MTSTLPSMTTPAPRTKEIKSICVFCGSGNGGSPEYIEQAKRGGSVGVMGAIAQAVIENKGKATGIVPEPLFRAGSKQIAETIIVPDMHTRKKTMGDYSDAFVVLPGGFGTFEEMLEMITWSQLNIHSKPILLLNTRGFYTKFVEFIRVAVQEKFIRDENEGIFVMCDTIEELLDALKTYEAPSSRYGLNWTVSKDGYSGRALT